MKTSGYTALITGASAGLGLEFARQLAPEAGTLLLVARRQERLEALKEELTLNFPTLRVLLFSLDLSAAGAVSGLVEELKKRAITVDFLINNAGLGDMGTFQTSEWERVHSMLRVNIEALTELTHALLPGMIERREGAVLNVASTAGLLPLPTFAVYAATKAYVCSVTEALAIEARPFGVTFTALCPGPVATEFGEVAQRPNSKRQFAPVKAFYVPPQQVVREALAGVRRGKTRVIPGTLVRCGALLLAAIPLAVLRCGLSLAGKFTASPEKA